MANPLTWRNVSFMKENSLVNASSHFSNSMSVLTTPYKDYNQKKSNNLANQIKQEREANTDMMLNQVRSGIVPDEAPFFNRRRFEEESRRLVVEGANVQQAQANTKRINQQVAIANEQRPLKLQKLTSDTNLSVKRNNLNSKILDATANDSIKNSRLAVKADQAKNLNAIAKNVNSTVEEKAKTEYIKKNPNVLTDKIQASIDKDASLTSLRKAQKDVALSNKKKIDQDTKQKKETYDRKVKELEGAIKGLEIVGNVDTKLTVDMGKEIDEITKEYNLTAKDKVLAMKTVPELAKEGKAIQADLKKYEAQKKKWDRKAELEKKKSSSNDSIFSEELTLAEKDELERLSKVTEPNDKNLQKRAKDYHDKYMNALKIHGKAKTPMSTATFNKLYKDKYGKKPKARELRLLDRLKTAMNVEKSRSAKNVIQTKIEELQGAILTNKTEQIKSLEQQLKTSLQLKTEEAKLATAQSKQTQTQSRLVYKTTLIQNKVEEEFNKIKSTWLVDNYSDEEIKALTPKVIQAVKDELGVTNVTKTSLKDFLTTKKLKAILKRIDYDKEKGM